MTKKRKIIIGVIVSIVGLFFVLVFLSLFFSFGMMAPLGDIDGSPDLGPIPPNSVDRLLDKMEFGAIAFNAPSKININDSLQIQLLLSLAETVDKLKQSIVEEGEKVGATIRVSDRMEARLTGYMFQITAITPDWSTLRGRKVLCPPYIFLPTTLFAY